MFSCTTKAGQLPDREIHDGSTDRYCWSAIRIFSKVTPLPVPNLTDKLFIMRFVGAARTGCRILAFFKSIELEDDEHAQEKPTCSNRTELSAIPLCKCEYACACLRPQLGTAAPPPCSLRNLSRACDTKPLVHLRFARFVALLFTRVVLPPSCACM